MKRGLGTQLRHLIELLDGAVSDAYTNAGLPYRPRYTPVMRAVIDAEPLTIGQIAELAGITQPAVTQTIALMIKDGLIASVPGRVDGRQRMIHLTDKGHELVPRLQTCWQATASAAAGLDAELAVPLSDALHDAIVALEAKSFGARIAEAHARLAGEPAAQQHEAQT